MKDAISQVLAIVPALQQLQQNLPQGGSSVAIPGLPRVDQPNFLRNMGMTIATRPAAQFSQAVGLAPLNEIGELEIEDRMHLDVITQRSKSKGLVARDVLCLADTPDDEVASDHDLGPARPSRKACAMCSTRLSTTFLLLVPLHRVRQGLFRLRRANRTRKPNVDGRAAFSDRYRRQRRRNARWIPWRTPRSGKKEKVCR